MKGYLLDTNVIIKFLQGKKEAIGVIEALIGKDLYISVVTIAEYYQGSYRLKNPNDQIKLLDSFIEKGNISILEISKETAAQFGILQGTYTSKGKPKPIFDLLLAATCIIYDLTIVTFNTKDFEGMKEIRVFDIM